MDLRVLTYNIKSCQYHRDGLAAVADVIRHLGPDIVALQEVDRGTSRAGGADQVQELAGRSGLAHSVFARAVAWPGGGDYGLGLLSAHPIRQTTVTHLPIPTDFTAPRSLREPRAMLSATIQTGRGSLHVLTTHFGLSADQRRAQAAAALELLGNYAMDTPWLVLGDLNGEPGTPEIESLRSQLTDAMASWSLEERWTFPTDPAASHEERLACDYVLSRGPVRVRRCEVMREERDASDHFPVMAEIRL